MRLFLTGTLCDARNASADAAAVGFRADGTNFNPIVFRGRVAADELRRRVDAIHDEIEVAVVVKIAEGTAARRSRSENSRAGVERNVFEFAVAEIAVEKFALRIACFGGELLD